MRIELVVDGVCRELEVEPYDSLLRALRDRLGNTGSKDACLEGRCGSCTVLVDGRPAYGCLVLAAQAHGAVVETIEGLTASGRAGAVQAALVELGAIQCGFCTPGIVVSAVALLERSARPDDTEIREALVGNLCRCTGYVRIVEAVARAAET